MITHIDDLFEDMEKVDIRGEMKKPVTNIAVDSRSVKEGDLFFAIRGYESDGHRFVDQAIQIDAKAVWMQLGISNSPAADRARQAGLAVVMDACMLVEHQHWGGLAPSPSRKTA